MIRICKRLLALLLAACLLASMLPVALAADARSRNGESTDELSLTASSGENFITVRETADPAPGGSATGSTLSLTADATTLEVKRDYDQKVSVNVTNESAQAVKYYLECENSYDDIYMNFVSSGSKDAPLVISEGETQAVVLNVFAQNAKRTRYTVKVNAVAEDGEIVTMNLTFGCEAASGTVSFTARTVDNTTLTRTYTVKNTSAETITDLTLSIGGEAADYVRISPNVENYEIAANGTVDVKLIPDLGKMKANNKSLVSGTLIASGGASSEEEISFDTQGQTITSTTMGQLALIQDENQYSDLKFDENTLSFTTGINGTSKTMKDITAEYYVEGDLEKDGVNTAEELDAVLGALIDESGMIDFTISDTMLYNGGKDKIPVSVRVASEVVVDGRARSMIQEGTFYDETTGEVKTCYRVEMTPEEYWGYVEKINDAAGALDITNWKQMALEDFNLPEGAKVALTVESSMQSASFEFFKEYLDDTRTFVDYSKVTDIGQFASEYDAISDIADITGPLGKLGDIANYIGTGVDIYKTGSVLANPNFTFEQKAEYTSLQTIKNLNTYFGGAALSKGGVAIGTAVADGPGAVVGFFAGHVISGLLDWWLSGLIDDMEEELYASMFYDIYGRQCTNASKVTSTFYVPDFGDINGGKVYETGRMYDGSPYGGNAGYAEDQFGGDSYIHNRDVNYDYILNGRQVGSTQNNGLTQVSVVELPFDKLQPGKNTLVRDYDTDAGHYSVVADTEITILYPVDAEISYIGEPEGLEDVRMLPDFAVYTENILPGAAIVGEQTEVKTYVYNRGSRRGWVDITVSDGTNTLYEGQNIQIDAFSEKEVTFDWTPVTGNTDLTVTLVNKSIGLDERKTDNNTAKRTIAARSREVPEIGDITPAEVTLASSSVNFIAGISKIADVISVSFSVDETACDANTASLTALTDSTAQVAVRVSGLTAGEHTVKVAVTYQSGPGTTATVEKEQKIVAADPDVTTFNVDATVVDPGFTVINSNGTRITTASTTETGYSITHTADMMDGLDDYYLVTTCAGGLIVSRLDTLGGAVLSLNGAKDLTIDAGPEVEIKYVRLDRLNGMSLSSLLLSPNGDDVIKYIGVESCRLNIQYEAAGMTAYANGINVAGMAVDGTVDLANYYKLYRVDLPDGRGYTADTYFDVSVQYKTASGRTSYVSSSSTYDAANDRLTVLVYDRSSVEALSNASEIKLQLTVDSDTLYLVDLSSYAAPVSAEWNHQEVTYTCSGANSLEVFSLLLEVGDDTTVYLWGDKLYLPAGTYPFEVGYTADKQQCYHNGTLTVADRSVVVELPSPIENPAQVTFTWPSIWDDHAYIYYTSPDVNGKPWNSSAWLSKGDAVLLPSAVYSVDIQLDRYDDSQNMIAYAMIEMNVTLAEEASETITIGNTFTGTASNSNTYGYYPGSSCYIDISELKDANGTVLTQYDAFRSAGYLNGTATLTHKTDGTKKYIVPLSVSSFYRSVSFSLPDDIAAGDYTYEIVLTTAEIAGNEYTITFDANGGSGVMPPQTVESGTRYTLPACGFGVPAGKVFKSWSIDGIEYAPGQTYEVDGSITVYAVWKDASSGETILPNYPAISNGSGTSSLPVRTSTTTLDGVSITETIAAPTASTKNGEASASVSTSLGNEIIKQAKANDSQNIVIVPKFTGNVTKTEVSIPAAIVGEIGSQTSASLTVSTPVAEVAIPNGGLSSLSGEGGTVTVTVEKSGSMVEFSVTAGRKTPDNVPGGMTLTVPMKQTVPGTVAVLVHEDGTQDVVRKSVAREDRLTIPVDGSAKLKIVDNSRSFDDVPDTSWAADAVAFAGAHELFNGTGKGQFSPNLPMSRGMLATVLHNLEGNPDPSVTDVFDDVDESRWYAEGVAWAAAEGIVGGYSNGRFGPNDNITREQLVVMLWRYAGNPTAMNKTLDFIDSDQTSDWALEALLWATEKGVINGKGNGILDPTGNATRAETAQMLKNFMEG